MRRRDVLSAGFAAGLAATLPASGALAQGTAGQASAAPRRAHALSLLGEPALPEGFPHFPWVNPDAPKGGEITLHALGSYDSFNPFILRGTPANGAGSLYDPLLRVNPDEPSGEYAHVAEYVELPADGRSVTFVLRDIARWHDGRPITAEDVVWTFNILRTSGRPFYRAYWGDVTEVVAEDPRRVTFRVKDAENRELTTILGQILVLPKHWWEGRDFSRPLLEAPLGSGAYKVDRFEAGRSVTYRRVPDYWARDLNTMKGTSNWDVLRYDYYRDATVALEAFKAGAYDFRTENVAREWATGYDFPAVRRGLVKRDEIRHELPTGLQGFIMNERRPLFQDRRVREALGLVFDFEWMNKNLFYEAYTRTTSYFSNSEFASSGLPQGRELEILQPFRDRLPPEVFTQEFKVPVTDGTGNIRDQARRALDLLRAAGWTIRDRRLTNAAGQRFDFEILLNGATFERIALPYIQNLQRLGIEARVRTVDPPQYQVRMDAFDYDMTVEVFGQSESPGNEQRDFWTSAKADENGSRNTIGIKDPVVDALVDLLIAAPNLEELRVRTRALDRVLLWGHHAIPQWHSRTFRIAWWDKFGRPERNPRRGLGLDSWWVDAARERALAEARRS
ncbi:extracellular solute-binding protein [Roseomonas sp. CCTCC AB2023176]|uniref:extracellular solute-binding protein n=1 Tax=Roseomonas sp. CCTCC AB2023176 TaxID=3342640 RepID=UPI0035D56E31